MLIDLALPPLEVAPLPEARHPIKLDGVCSIKGGPDVACAAIEVSLSSLIVKTSANVEPMDEVILNLPHLGVLEAVVARVFEGGFELHFDPAPQSKLGILVTWIEGTTPTGDTDREARRYERMVPIKRLITLRRGDGEPPSLARIVDLSRSGVAFTTSKDLTEGEQVSVGAFAGRVVRLFDGGAAVHFDELIHEVDFDVLIDLDHAAPAAA